MTSLTTDPSQVIEADFRGILYENFRPEIFDKWLREKLDAAPLTIFAKSLNKFFPFDFILVRKDRLGSARKQDADHFEDVLMVE